MMEPFAHASNASMKHSIIENNPDTTHAFLNKLLYRKNKINILKHYNIMAIAVPKKTGGENLPPTFNHEEGSCKKSQLCTCVRR